MRGLQLLLLGVFAELLGLATSNLPAKLIGLAAIVMVLLALGYRRLLSGRIRAVRAVSASVVNWGGVLLESVTIGNSSRLAAVGMRVVDGATLPQHARGYVTTLPARRTVTWNLAVPCQTRGRFQLGPLYVTTSDPLGLLPSERRVEPGQSVLVLPRYVPLTRCFFALDGLLPGTARGRARGEAPPTISGLRAYQPGDALARIHWRASARTGQLISKQFEPETQTTLWLALDLDRMDGRGKTAEQSAFDPRDLPEAEELLVTVAASLGVYALGHAGLNVGLIASGAHPVLLAPERGPGRQRRLLEALAEVQMGQQATLREYAARMEPRLAAQHTVVLLTARPASVWSGWLRRLMQRGIAVRVVAVAPNRTPDALETSHARDSHARDSAGAVAAKRAKSDDRQLGQLEIESGWPVLSLVLPVALADHAYSEDLLCALEFASTEAAAPAMPVLPKTPG
jgi:uncharacterized protein (DUF58 family)